MKVLVEIKDNKAAFVMELLRSFSYVKAQPITPEKYDVLEGIRQAVDEVKLHKQGKIKLKSAKSLLNEL